MTANNIDERQDMTASKVRYDHFFEYNFVVDFLSNYVVLYTVCKIIETKLTIICDIKLNAI
jgi:hypothetical protein